LYCILLCVLLLRFYVYFMCAAIGVIINDDDDDIDACPHGTTAMLSRPRVKDAARARCKRIPCKVHSLQIPPPLPANSASSKFISLQILFIATSTS